MEVVRHDDSEGEISQIASWFAGKNILITGGTGFMGKVLVEKLLRSCAGVKTIYLLIRSKKGIDVSIRKEQYFKCVIFKKLMDINPEFTKKVKVVRGDVLEDGLGLSINDTQELASNVDVVFHCAANVRFDQPLRPMVEMNVAGTLKVLKLAETMTNLKVFAHVSTSYCQCNESVLEERAYPAPQNPFDIMDMVDKMDDKALAEITPQLLKGLPNTYAYSKALSEDLICRYGKKFPIIITRPSIVTAALTEPLPGWIEGVNGPTGLMIGAARGVIRSMHCNPEYAATIIPVDKAINGLIVAAYDRSQSKSNNVEFYNLCISSKYLYCWGDCIHTGKRYFYETPLSFSLWYPDGSIKKSYIHHMLCVIFLHYLPAYFIDFWLYIFGQKPFLVHVQNKISTGLKLLQYYTTKDWDFRNDRFQNLSSIMNHADRRTFNIEVDQINWEKYIGVYIRGMRSFILGESDASLPKARKLLRRLYLLDRGVKFLFFALFFWYLWTHLDSMVERGDKFIQSSLHLLYRNNNSTFVQ